MLFKKSNRHRSFLAAHDAPVEAQTLAIGRELIERARGHRGGMLSGAFWSEKLMAWAMHDPRLKAQLFRFVDCFPSLHDRGQIHAVLAEYLAEPGIELPASLSIAMKAGGLMKGTLATTITSQIEQMAGRFILGTSPDNALPRLRRLWDDGYAFSVDLLGEACVSDAEAAVYQQRYLDLLQTLATATRDWPANDVLERDHLGAIPRVNVSVKISALYARASAVDFEESLNGLYEAILPLLHAARNAGALINFDMEQHALKDLTIALFKRCCENVDFHAGLAIQAYLRFVDRDIADLVTWSQRLGRQVTVRLIKGAYWDYEQIHAEEKGWPSPVWSRKVQTDAEFERATESLVAAIPRETSAGGIKLALGSHNARSIAHALACVRASGLPDSAIELQMLHGMADELKLAAKDMGLRVREYAPIGELLPGMAYLVRRLLENTSNESWLRSGFAEEADTDVLLAAPKWSDADPPAQPPHSEVTPAVEGVDDGSGFRNAPPIDFADMAQRSRFAATVTLTPLGDRPPDVGEGDLQTALATAAKAFPSWRDADPHSRATVLTRTAERMYSLRDELAVIMIREAGKTWAEADADVCEAIDFCEYYARAAVPLFERRRLGNFLSELNETLYQARGVAAVISPWNFPLAICCGMTVAALVTGNTVLVKPAEQTPRIAQRMCEILWEAGVPRDVLHFVPGPGETIGASLVRDKRVALIAFTGSKAVGLDIIRAAGVTADDQPFVKRVVCEMGGKNAIIVDSTADLDEAVLGVRASAFGFAGQKCSACSRVIVLDDVHDVFLRRLIEATRTLRVGDPLEPGTDVGPVIDADAKRKILSYIEIGRGEGTLELAIEVDTQLEARMRHCFVGPHVFSGIRPEHRLATEEVFGPVLAVMRANSFDEALQIANATSYKLTGGVYTRRPTDIERAKREFRVGNLYINRGITGALVGRQPFGGFGLSGVGSKAGGPDYLLQFVEPRAICENTMRRGFSPEATS